MVEVGCAPRGRPVSLGPYDNLVQVAVTCFDQSNLKQEAIKQLKERGEKVTTFVVIAVAKQVFTITCQRFTFL